MKSINTAMDTTTDSSSECEAPTVKVENTKCWTSSSSSSAEDNCSKRKINERKRIRLSQQFSDSSSDSDTLGESQICSLLDWKYKQLQEAINRNDTAQARQIITENYVELSSNTTFSNLLWMALNNSNTEIMSMLVYARVDVNITGYLFNRGKYLLHEVARKASTEEYEKLAFLLLKYGANVNLRDSNGNSVLHAAVEGGSLRLIQKLLELGAEVDSVDAEGTSVLNLAVMSSKSWVLLPLLVHHNVGNSEQLRNRRAMEALRYLLQIDGDLATIKALLHVDLPINDLDWRQDPLLYQALFHHHSDEVVKLMLEHGANPNQKLPPEGETILWTTSCFPYSLISALLIKHNARIDERNDNGQYPLHAAFYSGSTPNIRLLLDLGADTNVVDNNGHTPFFLNKTLGLRAHTQIIIQHFAILTSKNVAVNENDLLKINQCTSMRQYYQCCLKELECMKTLIIHNGISAYSILTCGMKALVKIVRHNDFVQNYRDIAISMKTTIPIYSKLVRHTFKTAYKMRTTMNCAMQAIDEVTNSMLPQELLEMIVSYSFGTRLIDYYLR